MIGLPYVPTVPLCHLQPKPKLTTAQRQEIARRRMDGATAIALAAEYGVSTRTIYEITPHGSPA